MRPEETIAACRLSHRRLLLGVAPLSAIDLRGASGLPGWSRAHVLAHLINKARAHVWLFGGPTAGEVRRLFPLGHDQSAAVDARATNGASDLRVDLEQSFRDLEAAWDALDDELWNCVGRMTAGPRTMSEIVGHHLRDVEVHHVDLRIGYVPTDWPPEFVESELRRRLRGLPDRTEHAELLAWLLGRSPAPELGPW